MEAHHADKSCTMLIISNESELSLNLYLFSTSVFEEPEDPGNRSFFSEIISSVSDVKFSHSGRYLLTRDYLTVKVWDLNMEKGPVETYQVGIIQVFTQQHEHVILPTHMLG